MAAARSSGGAHASDRCPPHSGAARHTASSPAKVRVPLPLLLPLLAKLAIIAVSTSPCVHVIASTTYTKFGAPGLCRDADCNGASAGQCANNILTEARYSWWSYADCSDHCDALGNCQGFAMRETVEDDAGVRVWCADSCTVYVGTAPVVGVGAVQSAQHVSCYRAQPRGTLLPPAPAAPPAPPAPPSVNATDRPTRTLRQAMTAATRQRTVTRGAMWTKVRVWMRCWG